MNSDIIYLIGLIIASGFFSGGELSYLISNRLKVQIQAGRKSLFAKSARYFMNHSDEFFSTILLGNNVVNIAFASLSAVLFAEWFNLNEFEILIASTAVILLFGELIPKFIAGEIPHTLYILSSGPLRVFSIVLAPLVILTSKISRKVTGDNKEAAQSVLERDDLILLVNESLDHPESDQQQSRIIQKIFDLKETRVYEVMRPRTEIVGIESGSDVESALKKFAESGYSKLPVYEDTLDNIKGVIYGFDLFNVPLSLDVIMKEVPFIPETKQCNVLLNEMLVRKQSLAIVVDEFGGTAGLVTLEDVLEEMFGEIRDEFDTDDLVLKKTADNTFLISGSVEIDHIVERFGLDIPDGDYTTLSGFITAFAGKIPEQGEVVRIQNFHFNIIKANSVRIEFVRLKIIED